MRWAVAARYATPSARIENGAWTRQRPEPADYQKRLTPHARGAILVAAVFDAFIAIYKSRTADLLRIYTGGTGVLPPGAIHRTWSGGSPKRPPSPPARPEDVHPRARLLPPVDITFGEYLRGLITADFDLVRDDHHNYRVAFVEAFRRRGIYPLNIGLPDLRHDPHIVGRHAALAGAQRIPVSQEVA